ncbi:hypothetical protein L484_011172 [Morus notabilis]|uniref:Uncharacterized protein n=1 Tax=Morus notabilis TaxID=981085 RepID=W9QK97_9ROSA|nr:hypothetical protein L484_011172 [Morus notabilis]
MDLTPFKKDIDELIADFSEAEALTLAEMKRVWLSKKFSYIYEATPSSNLAFFMQSLFGHAIEELKKLKSHVVTARENGLKVVPALVKKMLDKNMFLFGFVDINEGAVAETLNQLTELQNARIQVLYAKLFDDTRIQDFLHMDMGMEIDLNLLKNLSTEYSDAKKLAIHEARQVVDVRNIEHIAQDDKLVGDAVEKITEEWNVQKGQFYEQTGLMRQHQEDNGQQQEQPLLLQNDDNFDQELEQLLS